MMRRPTRSTQGVSSAASDVYKRQFKGKLFVSNRDFLMIEHMIMDKKTGAIRIAVTTVEDPRAPPVKGVVRAKVFVSGYHINPLPGNKCQIIFAGQFDMAGSLPTFVQNMVNKRQGRKSRMICKAFANRFGPSK
eukprot:TRINITY_DN31931_c0_g1_i1.p2 TRINITY_DN31931_c0_g1~~TRINITY_DN31931_c0_g1_i1.p2  ORF type:complete len:134 (+),score=17.33 TRINITY_DN31931_c0_g1_i1:63-464(+)